MQTYWVFDFAASNWQSYACSQSLHPNNRIKVLHHGIFFCQVFTHKLQRLFMIWISLRQLLQGEFQRILFFLFTRFLQLISEFLFWSVQLLHHSRSYQVWRHFLLWWFSSPTLFIDLIHSKINKFFTHPKSLFWRILAWIFFIFESFLVSRGIYC